MTDTAIAELAPQVGVRAACEVLGAAQAGYYRRHRQSRPPQRPDPIPADARLMGRADGGLAELLRTLHNRAIGGPA